jgi:RHS repeat-associated protein
VSTWNNALANPDGALLSGNRTDQIFSIYDYAENFTMSPFVQLPNNQTLVSLLGANSGYYVQNNLSGNIALSYKKNGSTFPAITWYSYDLYGRVEWMVQFIEGIGVKTIDYEYDYNGNVKKISYQKRNNTELFVHRYSYDLNGVLKRVETSTNDITFSAHADYSYYLTGELKRINIAKGLQGLDYVYTLGGNLKSINHPSLDIAQDPGHDSNDLFGITLDYYSGDYVRQNTNITASPSVSGYNKDQYTGNIKATRWATKHANMDFVGGTVNQKAYLYNYDKNNWLTNATFGTASNSAFVSPTSNYTEGGISFDANGNIRTLNRTNSTGLLVDRLIYNYSGNRLNYVRENAAPTADVTDIENQNVDNYQYDVLGQLKRNNLEKLEYNYNVQGLTTNVINLNNNRPLVTFQYNERGQRVKKESFNTLTGALISTDYYLLDLSGNVMSIYTKPNDSNPLAQKELPIYGLKRLGVYFKSNGTSNYEISDHLGNVRAVIQKIPQNPFLQMLAYNDYYPFGEKLPGRNSSSNYRYAFQGQERDGETGMEAFQLRLWDGRIGRWLSRDPYVQFDSPYIGMGNNPVRMIDRDGGWCEDGNGNRIPCNSENLSYMNSQNHIVQLMDVVITKQNGVFGHGLRGTPMSNGFQMAGFQTWGLYNDGINNTHFNISGFGMNYGNYSSGTQLDLRAEVYGVKGNFSVESKSANGLFGGSIEGQGSLFSANMAINGGGMLNNDGITGVKNGFDLGAYTAQGDITGKTTILGAVFTGTIGGSVASAHIGGHFNMYWNDEDGSLNITGLEHFGFGVGEKIGIHGELPLRSWYNLIK